jgi:hypothetical protein
MPTSIWGPSASILCFSSRMLKKVAGVAETIPVLAQRAASEGCEGAGRPFFLLAEPPR